MYPRIKFNIYVIEHNYWLTSTCMYVHTLVILNCHTFKIYKCLNDIELVGNANSMVKVICRTLYENINFVSICKHTCIHTYITRIHTYIHEICVPTHAYPYNYIHTQIKLRCTYISTYISIYTHIYFRLCLYTLPWGGKDGRIGVQLSSRVDFTVAGSL